jgi:hypothetical protein
MQLGQPVEGGRLSEKPDKSFMPEKDKKGSNICLVHLTSLSLAENWHLVSGW